MSSFLVKMKSVPGGLVKHALPEKGGGLAAFAVDKGERYVGAFAFGAAKGYWREKFMWKGQGLDLWIGALLTILGSGLNAYSGGRSRLAPHLERFGDQGVSSALNSLGAGWGAQKAGRTVSVSQAQMPAAPTNPVLGFIPNAVNGDYLTDDEVRKYTSPRQ